jgi:hypothetical protein
MRGQPGSFERTDPSGFSLALLALTYGLCAVIGVSQTKLVARHSSAILELYRTGPA